MLTCNGTILMVPTLFSAKPLPITNALQSLAVTVLIPPPKLNLGKDRSFRIESARQSNKISRQHVFKQLRLYAVYTIATLIVDHTFPMIHFHALTYLYETIVSEKISHTSTEVHIECIFCNNLPRTLATEIGG